MMFLADVYADEVMWPAIGRFAWHVYTWFWIATAVWAGIRWSGYRPPRPPE